MKTGNVFLLTQNPVMFLESFSTIIPQLSMLSRVQLWTVHATLWMDEPLEITTQSL